MPKDKTPHRSQPRREQAAQKAGELKQNAQEFLKKGDSEFGEFAEAAEEKALEVIEKAKDVLKNGGGKE